jgi:hypothetical protein
MTRITVKPSTLVAPGLTTWRFKVDTRNGLDEWLARFEQMAVIQSPTTDANTARC